MGLRQRGIQCQRSFYRASRLPVAVVQANVAAVGLRHADLAEPGPRHRIVRIEFQRLVEVRCGFLVVLPAAKVEEVARLQVRVIRLDVLGWARAAGRRPDQRDL